MIFEVRKYRYFLKSCMLKPFYSFPIYVYVGYLTKHHNVISKMMWLLYCGVSNSWQCMGSWHTLPFFLCASFLTFQTPHPSHVQARERKSTKNLLWFSVIKCIFSFFHGEPSHSIFPQEVYCVHKIPCYTIRYYPASFCLSGHARSAIFYLLPTSLNFRSRNKEHKYKNYAILHFL